MKEEVRKWLDQAKEDLDTANFNYRGKYYKTASFLCQQTVEKAFKAVLLEKKGELRKIHDLVELGKDINAPKNLIDDAKELTSAYIYSRYPDIKIDSNLKQKVSKFLTIAKEALEWAEKNL